MSPRHQRPRKISDPPVVSGLKPYGGKLPSGKPETIFLNLEEFEALRLCDHKGLNHQLAAAEMEVSRPTLTRIHAHARQKVAAALVEGKQLIIEGGKVYFDSDWYSCNDCGCFFNHPDKTIELSSCALCGSSRFTRCTTDPEPYDEV